MDTGDDGHEIRTVKLRVSFLPLLLLYPLYAGVMYAEQRTILFPAAERTHHPLRAELPARAQLIELPATFGKVRAVYWSPAEATRPAPAILYLHGNFERVEDSFDLLQPLLTHGIAVLQVEFPGYGGADGTPTYDSVNESTDLAWDWLARQSDVDPARMLVMGYSIGGGPAAALTQRRHPAGLILLSTYASLASMAQRYALPHFLVRYPWDSLARVRDYSGPSFIEHGHRDNVIPFAMGEELAAASTRAEFVPLDCGHDNCHFDQSVFAQRLPAWMKDNGLLVDR